MKKSIFFPVVGLFILLSFGCAPVKFYSNPGLTNKTGLKFFTAKPYLQIERELSNNTVIKQTVIYLPDLSNPQYLIIKDGLGSRKVDVKLTDGTINTLGLSTDPKIAEAINAMASLITKSSGAITDLGNFKSALPATSTNNVVTELYEVVMGPEGTVLKKVEYN
jgi:hypothetical protein